MEVEKKEFLFGHEVEKLPGLWSLINFGSSLGMTLINCVILDKSAHFLLQILSFILTDVAC